MSEDTENNRTIPPVIRKSPPKLPSKGPPPIPRSTVTPTGQLQNASSLVSESRMYQDGEPASQGFIETIRTSIPDSTYTAEATIKNSPNVTAGTLFKNIVSQLPNSEPAVEGNALLIRNLDRSLKLGLLDLRIAPLQWLDFDRRSWDISARFTVAKHSDTTTITAEIHQGWTRFAVWMLAVPFLGWAMLINIFVRTKLFGNRRIRAAIQKMLDDLAKGTQRNAAHEKLNSALDNL